MNWTSMEEDLIRDEGLRLRAYTCPAGYPTIGVGHRMRPADIDRTISLETAGYLLSRDISNAMGTALELFGREQFDAWPDARQRAICNMIFNLGEEGFLGFKNMIAAIRADDWQAASRHCLDSKYARQVGQRAKRIAHQLRSGVDA